MENVTKHYELLITGDGFNLYPTKTIDVYCTKKTLEEIARAMIAYIYNFTDGRCCCLAKENGGVSLNDWDIMFADCM